METHRDLWPPWAYSGARALGRSPDSAFRGRSGIAPVLFLPPRTAEVDRAQSPAWVRYWRVSADLLQSHCARGPELLVCAIASPSGRRSRHAGAAPDMGEPAHRDGVGCPAYGNRGQPALPAKCYPAFWIADARNTSMCPVPGRLGGWLSHPMVHGGLPSGLRLPAIPPSPARGHDTKHLFRGTAGGTC